MKVEPKKEAGRGKIDEYEEDEEPKSMKGPHHYIILALCMLCVLLGVVGPIYAFTAISCSSTASCQIGQMLGLQGGYCEEGGGERSSVLAHGQKCTVICPLGLAPTAEVLRCDDGTTLGGEDFQCRIPPPKAQTGTYLGGLVKNAITTGPWETVSRRVDGMKCVGIPGGTAVLLRLEDLTDQICQTLLAEVREVNGEFEWMQFEEYPGQTTPVPDPTGPPPDPPTGVCSLGCFNERPVPTEPPPLPPVVVQDAIMGDQRSINEPGWNLCGGVMTDALPICVSVNGSCNKANHGDYYRNKDCAGKMPQWVMLDESHRIRYDNRPTTAQGGKWILEGGIEPKLNTFGDFDARQNTFDVLPVFGWYDWTFRCRDESDPWNVVETFQVMPLLLGPCTCTDWDDCSGHGKAIGGKEIGPNCGCLCDSGWSGADCSIPLCKAPQIFNGADISCEEGEVIPAGTRCTAACMPGFKSDVPFITCNDDAQQYTPNLFYCTKSTDINDLAAAAAAQFAGTTTPRPDCGPQDCSFRGKATGERYADESCVCKCLPLYTGNNCRTYAGNCMSPLAVENAQQKTCFEGTTVSTICTPMCEEGYWPYPEMLTCTAGSNKLEPETFKCFGGKAGAGTFCQSMQHASIGISVFACCVMSFICLYEAPVMTMKHQSFVLGNNTTGVDVKQDEDGGKHYVVVNEARDPESHLPERLKDCEINAPLHTGTDHILHTHDRRYEAAKEEKIRLKLRKAAVTLALSPEDGPKKVLKDDGLPIVEADLESASNSSVSGWAPGPGDYLTVALPGSIPPMEEKSTQMSWQLQYNAIQAECERKRYEEAQDAGAMNISAEQKAALEKEEATRQAVIKTEEERSVAEDAMQDAMARGDGEALKEALVQTRNVLAKLVGAPANIVNMLVRLERIGQRRYEQYYEKNDKFQAQQAWLQRIRDGRAADWKMSAEEFWKYCEYGNLHAVEAGLMAKMPVLIRSTDGKRRTVLHEACRPACLEALQSIQDYEEAVAGIAAADQACKDYDAQVAAYGEEDREAERKAAEEAAAKAAAAAAAQAEAEESERQIAAGERPKVRMTMREKEAAKKAKEEAEAAEKEAAEAAAKFAAEEKVRIAKERQERLSSLDFARKYRGPSLEAIEKNRVETESNRLGIIKGLIEAKASPNTMDCDELSALDLCILEGGSEGAELPIVQKLKDLGMKDAQEAALGIIKADMERKQKQGGSRLTGIPGMTPKPKAKPSDPFSPPAKKSGFDVPDIKSAVGPRF